MLHHNNKQSADIVQALEKDGCTLIGPFTTTADAYVAVLKEDPDYAVIDADISLEKTNSLSNTLIQLNIEHLILLDGRTQILKRRINHGVLRGVLSDKFINLITGIRSELMALQANSLAMTGKSQGDDKLTV